MFKVTVYHTGYGMGWEKTSRHVCAGDAFGAARAGAFMPNLARNKAIPGFAESYDEAGRMFDAAYAMIARRRNVPRASATDAYKTVTVEIERIS